MSEKLTEEILKDINKNSSVSRRDALKMAMATPLALSIFGAEEAQAMPVSDAKGKIVIVGGGLSGLSTAARLCRRLKNPDVTLIEPNEHSVSYQAGTSLIAADVYKKEDVWYNTKDYMPSEVKWIKRSAANFDPENNTVILDNGERISYDYLIIAMGMTLNYGRTFKKLILFTATFFLHYNLSGRNRINCRRFGTEHICIKMHFFKFMFF